MEKTIYKLENAVLYYFSIKTQFPGTIITSSGILNQSSETKFDYYSNIDVALDQCDLILCEKEKSYNYKPKFMAVKIGINLSDLDPEDQLNEWITITQNLEHFLWITGNGFVYNDTFDLKINKAICAYGREGNLYTAIFSSVNPREVIGFLQMHLNNFSDPLPLLILEENIDMSYRMSLEEPEKDSNCEFPF